jgi:hypothetical protein
MKTTQTDRFFTPLSSTEAETINGGDLGTGAFISEVSAATGAYQFLPFFTEVVAFDGLNAWATGGSLGVFNSLIDAANFLTGV